jgi:subtilisin family serine protease
MSNPTHPELPARRRLVCSLVILGASATMVAAPVRAAPPGAAETPGSSATPPTRSEQREAGDRWRQRRDSLRRSPADVVAEAGANGELRFTVTRTFAGRLTVETRAARTTEAALDLVAQQQRSTNVLSIEPDARTIRTFGSKATPAAATGDPQRTGQWALTRLKAEQAWTSSKADGTKVAIIDTGVGHHEDLADSRILPGTDLSGAAGDGRNDGNGHGTHCAGIIGATLNNNLGIAGLAPSVSIIPVKVLDDTGSGYDSAVAQGITWATDHGADVISLSLGGPDYTEALDLAAQYAISRGVMVIAAAGNERQSGSPVEYPGALPGVVAVAATSQNDAYGSFSNAGSYVDLSAPGVGILSTLPGNRYQSWSGTSMATPYVAAAAALVHARAAAQHRTLAVPELTGILTSTADDLGPAGRDNDYGHGLIDPVSALAAVAGPQVEPTDAGDSLGAASPLPPGLSVDQDLRSAIDVDFWSFDVAAAGRVSLSLTGLPADYDLDLLSAAGATLGSSQNPGTTSEALTLDLPGGHYVAKVYPFGTPVAGSPYRLTVTRAAPPPVPGPVVITPNVTFPGVGQARIGWTPPGNPGGPPVTGYRVAVSAANSTTSFGPWSSTVATAFTFAGLVRGAGYRYRVVAVNSAGPSPVVTGAFRQANTPAAVRAPRVATWPAPGRATITWLAPIGAGGTPILRYLIQLSAPNSTTRFGAWQPATATSRTLIGLLRNADYRVRLIAVNSQGQSPAVTLSFRQSR